MKLSICLTPSYPWADVLRVAEHTERSGWAGVWFPDHFMATGDELPQPVLERWATLAGLAAVVPRVRLGALVCGNTYRHVTFHGQHYHLDDASMHPKPMGRLPLLPIVEGGVEQLRDTLGRYAAAGVDEFIVPAFRPQSPDETIALIDVLTSEVLPALR